MSNAAQASPQPTSDPTRAAEDLVQFGFCVVPDALSPQACERLRARLDALATAEQQDGSGYFDGAPNQNWGSFKDEHGRTRANAFSKASGGVNQRIWMLINKGDVFVDLLAHAQARALVDLVLGEHYLLSSYTANIANPGGVAMELHTDQWWMPAPTRRDRAQLPVGSINRSRFDIDEQQPRSMIAPPACCNVMWMLDDFTAQNGATRVVPGSHLSGYQPGWSRGAPPADTVAATGKAGSALVFDGRLWHGTGANQSNGTRRGILTTFCGPQFRPQENFTVGTSPEVLRNASADLRELLGFRVWCGYGRTGSPLEEYIDPHPYG